MHMMMPDSWQLGRSLLGERMAALPGTRPCAIAFGVALPVFNIVSLGARARVTYIERILCRRFGSRIRRDFF
jgi:hypothetical protein